MTNLPNSTIASDGRALLERAVESLIAFLDLLEPDPDLEDNGDAEEEPDREDGGDAELGLGWQNEGSQSCLRQSIWDREDEHDGREPSEDYEPSMGWPNPNRHVEGGMSQECLGGEIQDGELEPELGWTEMEARFGHYENGDREASLGWQNTGSQARLHVSPDDCEQQCEDEGSQCEDEGAMCEDEGADCEFVPFYLRG